MKKCRTWRKCEVKIQGRNAGLGDKISCRNERPGENGAKK
jgi:hypothetical protein